MTDEMRQIVDELKKTMKCNCNLDNWEPEISTGHSWVCDIHKKAITLIKQQKIG